MIPDLPSNSHKSRETPKEEKAERVVEGPVIRRKKSPGKRFGELFLSGDSHSVYQYVMLDVALPAIKDLISDMASSYVEQRLFGEARPRGSRGRRSSPHSPASSNYTSYNRYSSSTRGSEDIRKPLSRQARSQHDFDEVVLESRVEADRVLDKLADRIDRYDVATVSDLYDFLGESSNHADEKWGWTDISDAKVHRTRGGYLLDLPKPEPID